MDNFVFHRPTAYHFGVNKEQEVGSLIKELGKKRVLVVYGGGSCVRSGLLDSVHKSLEKEGIYFVDIGGVLPNPRADLVYDMIELGRKEQVDFVLAVGGGSVIDSAKAAAIGIVNDGDFFDFFLRKRSPQDALGVGVILTIPAAGSEGSASAVIQKLIDGKYYKRGLTSQYNVPVFSILNPELTKTLPNYQFACGAVDMLAHVMERYFTNTQGVALTDRICEAVMSTIIEMTPRILRDKNDYDARANLMWAGTLAHNDSCGIGREQDWASHGLEHQLSALYDVAHGAGLAIMLPAWMEYTIQHNPMRFAQFGARVFGLSMDFEEPQRTAQASIEALRSFFKHIGMPLSFKDIGAKEEDIPQMLGLLGVDDDTNFLGHYVPLYRNDCEAIYKIAANYQSE